LLRAGVDATRTAVEQLRSSQARDGGWGPFPDTPTEVFDTAMAVIALQSLGPASPRESIERGRRYLITSQVADGGWVETTRPSGAQSYAQRISTAAWALLALLESRTLIPGSRSLR
jgi:squalene cyclase